MDHAFPPESFQREKRTTFSKFHLFLATFHWNAWKTCVPLTSQPEFAEFLGKWKAPFMSSCTVGLLTRTNSECWRSSFERTNRKSDNVQKTVHTVQFETIPTQWVTQNLKTSVKRGLTMQVWQHLRELGTGGPTLPTTVPLPAPPALPHCLPPHYTAYLILWHAFLNSISSVTYNFNACWDPPLYKPLNALLGCFVSIFLEVNNRQRKRVF